MFKDKNLIQTLIWFGEQGILLVISLATIGAALIEVVRIIDVMTVNLSDLFLLFIYAEVLGMVAVFYKDHRIPITLPIIIAITALTRSHEHLLAGPIFESLALICRDQLLHLNRRYH